MEFDKEELELIKAYENDEFESVANLEQEIQSAKESAQAHFSKDARVNIRISSSDLNTLKRIAVQEGLPYQTFIASVLHKYATGNL